ncbi:MAG: hypothetical protein E6J77_20760 [Deltaproteobacteria bacterium]|nr:MAG: hypothetical protein E6J77_20760 [Deltaproteobacteria bacterium]
MRAPEAGPLSPDILFVYPTALKAGTVLRDEARRRGPIVGARVTTFPQLTEALARDLRVHARVLGPELATIILAQALDATDPRELRGAGRGLVGELLGTIEELKAAYLAPADVEAMGAALPTVAERGRIGAIARIYARYEAILHRLGAVDRHGREWRVCEGLAAAEVDGSRPRTIGGVRRIVFAEVYDFSVLQFLIATSLIRLIGDAELIAFAHPENVNATRFLDRTWNRFVGSEDIADQVLPSFVARGGRQGSLAAALRGVFAPERPSPARGDGSITFVVAPDRYREVEAAGRDIRTRLERGDPPERIAFLARDLTLYADLIEDVCRRFRIPIYFRKGRAVLTSGLVRACLNVLRCVAEGFPQGRFAALLDTDYFRAGGPSLARTLREVGFVAESARPLAECVAATAARATDDPAARASGRATLAARGEECARVMAVLRPLEGRRTVAAHVRTFRRALGALGLRPVLQDDRALTAARRDVRARVRFEETLTALAALTQSMGRGPVTLDDFVRLLVAALEPQEIEDPLEPAGSVRALSVRDARGLDFDVVYLLGLDAGTFPAPRRESPLLPDGLKRAMNPLAAGLLRRKLGARAAGLPLAGCLRTAREASLEDPFLFFLALSMPERALVLSCPAKDERGNPTVASPFVDEVAACLEGGLVPQVLSSTALVPEAASCCEPAELLARAALDRWAPARTRSPDRSPGRPPDRLPDRLAAALRSALPDGVARMAAIDARAAIEARRSRYFLTPRAEGARKDALADTYVGRLAGELGFLEAHVAAMRWSPTRLERLAACGFKFFAAYVLGLHEEPPPELDVVPIELGKIFHRVLEEFLRAHPRLPADRDAARALGRAFLAQTRTIGAAAIPAKDRAFFDLTWLRLEAGLDELIVREHEAQEKRDREGLTVERRLEQPIEFALPDPAGGPPLTLFGLPDRIEVERRGPVAERLRVLDYKVTRDARRYAAALDPERELGRTAFQLPVYLLATLGRGTAGVSTDTELEGGFLVLLARRAQQRLIEPLPRALLEGVVTERIHALRAHARAGRFDVDPDPCDPWCPYRTVCRYQPPPLEDED